MDERDDLYDQIIEEYKKTGSVKKVVENLHSNTIKVRRVLITEGLWESESSRRVGELYQQGKSVKEIAEILCISEKNVQSYMPYTRGAYGGEKSDDATRSEEYRSRMQNAAVSQASFTEGSGGDYNESVTESKYDDKIIEFPKSKKKKAENKKSDEEPRFPGVLKLRMELISPFFEDEPDSGLDLNEKEKAAFLKNAKAKEGIIREVLVPAEMNLHSMHYMIQKLFGWQNSHLHKFFLSCDDFNMVTDGRKVDDYMNLCGTLFRYPDSDLDDQFWDDDYDECTSIKTWLQSKYTYGFVDLAVENSFPRNLDHVRKFREEYKTELKKNKKMTLDELRDIIIFESGFNVLMESLSLRHVFIKCFSADQKMEPELWRKFQKGLIENRKEAYLEFEKDAPEAYDAMLDMLADLIELRKSVISFERAMHYGQSAEIKREYGKSPEQIIEELQGDIRSLEEILIEDMTDGNPKLVPFADSIYYNYDFGDDWTVKITCVDAYIPNQNYDWFAPDIIDTKTGKRKMPKEPLKFESIFGLKMSEEENGKLNNVYLHASPACVFADGLNVMDDVGGIHGFCDFLETINGGDPEEAEESRSWAKWMGWTGRKTKPENIL